MMTVVLACARVGLAQTDTRTGRRGTETVTIVGKRDGWTEIVLENGKRALVPSREVEENPAHDTLAPNPAPPAAQPQGGVRDREAASQAEAARDRAKAPPARGTRETGTVSQPDAPRDTAHAAPREPAPADGARPSGTRSDVGLAARTAASVPSADAVAALSVEVRRLRTIVDELGALRAADAPAAPPPPKPAPRSWLASDSLTMLGLALVVGVLIGGAVQRQRARRSRALRF